MKWLNRMLRRDPPERERAQHELAQLEVKSHTTNVHADQALRTFDEAQRIRNAVRGAVNAVQRTHRR